MDERPLTVTAAELHEDGCTLQLTIDDMQPTWCMSIRYDLKAENGAPVVGQIHNTVHQLGE
jgi:hypothetical protein